MLWVPAAVRQARRLVERYDIQAIVTTSPPHSAHLVGMNLKRRLGLPWIADLRDPILDNFAYRPGGGLTDRFWHWLERSIVHHTDHIVVTCPELADRLAARFSGVARRRFSTITNGYDPEDAPGSPPAATDTPPSARRFVLAYVGAFYREQTIEPVLRAVRALRTARLDFARAIEFRLIGSLSTGQRRLLQPGDSAFFSDLGYRSHDEALRELAGADVLLLMTPANEGGRLCIPAKTFEYLAFGGHVLGCVHEGTMLHRLLLGAGNTTFVDCRKPESLAPAIERCYDAWKAGALTSPRRMENLECYRRDRLAADFAKIVESFTQTATGKPVSTRSARSVRRSAKPGRDWAGSNRGVTRRPLAPVPHEAGA